MFKITPNPTFKATVAIPVHGGDAQELVVLFRHKDETELDEFYSRLELHGKKHAKTVKARIECDADVLLEFMADWEDADEEFCRESLIKLISNYKAAARCFLKTYETEMHQAAIKN